MNLHNMDENLQYRILTDRIKQIQNAGVPLVAAKGDITVHGGNYICHLGDLVETAVPWYKKRDFKISFDEDWISSGRALTPYYSEQWDTMARIAGYRPKAWYRDDGRGDFENHDFEIHQIYDPSSDMTYLFILPHRDFATGKRQAEEKRKEQEREKKTGLERFALRA